MSRKKWTSIAVKGPIPISYGKPPVHKILRMKATPKIARTSTVSGKVIYWGNLGIEIEYAAQTASGCIHVTDTEIPITGFLPCKRAKPGLLATLNGEIEFISFELVSPRNIDAFILVRLCIAQLICYPDGASLCNTAETGVSTAKKSEDKVYTGRLKRPTKISAWTRKQRY